MKICPSCKSEFGGGEVFCPNDGARLATHSQMGTPRGASADPMIGTVLSERYRILRRIGEGGMGLVYEAEHVAIEKRVALKVLRDDFSSRPEVVERFKQEAKSATRIGNAHIVDISDFGITPTGASYFVMELLEGEDLANVLEREGHLPLERAANILRQCCKALGAAHAKGIVHRDMKPENIFLTERDGRSDFVKIVDFGIAKMSDIETPGAPGRKLTKTGMIFGTPEYMSPEQAAGKPNLDHRVDIYALAVIFFEMITGRVPFVGDTFMGILTQHMFEDPPAFEDVNPRVAVPEAIRAFVYRGLAKDPGDRFQSCDEMAAALEEALAGRAASTLHGFGEPARPSGRPTPRAIEPAPTAELAVPARSRTGLVVGALAVGLAALAGGATAWYVGRTQASEASERVGPSERAGTSESVEPIETAGASASPAREPDAGPPPGPREADERQGALAAPPAVVDAGPAMVTVAVETDPAGARVFVVGRGEICAHTPCSFETVAGRPITVRATRGRSAAESELTPTANTQLHLEMRPVRRPPSKREGGGGTSGGGTAGDLKIPDIFR